MPNWCSNYVVISGEAKALKDYFNDVKKQMKIQQSIYEKRTDEEKAFKLDDKNWLRNLYPKYSTKKINEDWVGGNLNSRGSIEDFSFYEKDKKIIISADSAWSGIIEGLNDYLLNNHKGIYVEYGEEVEGGNGLFNQYRSKNKQFNDYEKMINVNISKDDYFFSDYGYSETVLDYINEDLNTNFKSFDDFNKYAKKHKYDVEIEEFSQIVLEDSLENEEEIDEMEK